MPYKSVFAIGDSFTRGDELADCPEQAIHPYRASFSRQTWPALIAKSLNIDYSAEAVGGRGNQWISFITGANSIDTSDFNGTVKQDTFLIVNWSWFERFDYIDSHRDDTWWTTHPHHDNKADHYFYKNIDNDIWSLHRNLQQMHSTIQLLKQNNIKFVMTCLDPGYTNTLGDIRPDSYGKDKIHGTEASWITAIDQLHKKVVPHILEFDGQTFLEWSHSNNFKCGPGGHPLEDAHAAAADYILVNKLHL